MWEYTETVKEHFLNPRNVGEIDNPDAVGEVGNITCGDMLRLTLRIDKETERIMDAKFKTFGCASAIASSSALTEIVKGKTLDEALKISNDDIAKYLGGLPEAKMHCSVMGRDALEKAISFFKTGDVPVPRDVGEDQIICNCFGVSKQIIERVIRENKLAEIEQVTHYCKAGGGCGGCHGDIEKIMVDVLGERTGIKAEPAPPKKTKMTNIEKMRLIADTIDREIRPQLRKDGGDIELVDIEGDKVYVTLRGACAQCVGAGFTLRSFVQAKLREFVVDSLEVEEAK
ncbi:Fe-S cluster assembly protein NifU [Acidobacteriota bacterium]